MTDQQRAPTGARFQGARPDWTRRTYWKIKDGLLWATDPRKGQTVRVRLPFGAAADLDLRLRNEWVLYRTVREGRLYEPELTALVIRLLKPGSSFVDGGANSGWYTLLAASRVKPAGRVWSIEASPRAWGRLTRNLALNPELAPAVTPLHGALTDHGGGTVRIYLDPKQDQLNSLDRPELGESVAVPTIRLCDLGIPPHGIIKLDVEGQESAAWDGWDHSVPATWLVEWEPALADATRKLVERLRGRKVWAVLPDPAGYRLEEVTEEWPTYRLNLFVPEA